MRALRLAIAMATTLTLVGAGLASAGEARPMTGQFTAGVVPAVQRCGADALTIGFEISGTASHVGRLSGSGTNCTEFTLATSAVAIWDGETTVTAADGSAITTSSAGTQSAPSDGIATFAVVHTVTGGTGRFAEASGVWLLTGTINFLTGTIEGTVDGWLSY